MRLRTLLPAAALVLSAAVVAQTPPPAGPTSGGKTPPPTAPGAGGKAPAPKAPGAGGSVPGTGPKVQFPTDRGQPAVGSGSVSAQFPTSIVQTPEVARSLSLTDRQLAQLNAATTQVRTQFQDQFNQLSALPERERAARALQLNREFQAAWQAAADDFITAQQLARFRQLQLQFDGFAALADPEIQRRLALTETQTGVLPNSLGWTDLQMQAILRQAELDRARATQMFNEFVQARQQRFNQFLTAEQLQRWREMTGDPFQFPPPFATTTVPGAATPPSGAGTPGPTSGGPARPGGPTTGGPVPPKK
jgi:hypothetical protein